MRPWRSLLLAATLATGLGARQDRPQAQPAAPEVAVSPAEAPAVALAHRVEQLKAALAKDKPGEVEAALAEVEALRRRYNALDVMPLVDAVSLWARQKGLEGRPQLGLNALEKVERWAPQHPSVLSSRIVLTRQLGLDGWLRSIPDVLRLTAKRLEHPTLRWLWIVQHFGGLRLMVTLLLWGWALTLAVRYRRVLRETWEERLRGKLGPFPMAVLGALILALPVVLGLDPGVAALFWLWLLVPYMHPPEIKGTVVVILLQLVHPLFGVIEPWAVQAPPPSLVTLQIQPQINPPAEAQLARLPEEDRSFLQGWTQLQRQDWPGAEATFRRLVNHHPDQAEVLNNLGVAEFMQSKAEAAEKDFTAAYQVNPAKPQVLMNQSTVAFGKLDTVTGALKQEAARAADPALFSELVNLSESKARGGIGERAFPCPLPDTPARVEALRAGEGGPAAKDYLSKPFLWSVFLPLLALGLVLLRLRQSVTAAHPTQCVRCGEPFHTTDSYDPEICSQCHHLFIVKDGLHTESRRKKVEQVAGHQRTTRWIHKALMFFLPGCDVAFMGDTAEGFWEWFFICFAVGVVVSTARTVRYPGEILPDPLSIWLPLGAVFVVVLYLRSWVKFLPQRRR